MILAIYNIAIFDKYFGGFGSDLLASRPGMFHYRGPQPLRLNLVQKATDLKQNQKWE